MHSKKYYFSHSLLTCLCAGQPGVRTHKRRRKRLNAAWEKVEVKAETEDEWTLKESEAAQVRRKGG